jgi:hypothetical protein
VVWAFERLALTTTQIVEGWNSTARPFQLSASVSQPYRELTPIFFTKPLPRLFCHPRSCRWSDHHEIQSLCPCASSKAAVTASQTAGPCLRTPQKHRAGNTLLLVLPGKLAVEPWPYLVVARRSWVTLALSVASQICLAKGNSIHSDPMAWVLLLGALGLLT